MDSRVEDKSENLTFGRVPLTAAELVKHPEFKHVTWALKPAKKGKVDVAKGRGGPLQIAYEIHGNGPTKLVVGITNHHDFFSKAKKPSAVFCGHWHPRAVDWSIIGC